MPISLWCQTWYLSTSVMDDTMHSLQSDRNMNEQKHSPVLVCVCIKCLLSDVNIKDGSRKGKKHACHG